MADVPWVRWGDTSANHPIVLSVLEHEECDDRLVNEVHGFISRCSAQAGAHTTDYVVTRGTAVLMAGPSRVDVMIAVAIFAGYISEIEVDGRTAYKLVDDDHDFLHLRLKEEIDWEKQRKSDNSNPALIVPVRLRDGDACRWCGNVVDWSAKTGGRAGTYDHLVPGHAATIDTYVVCCRSCNASKGKNAHPEKHPTLLGVPVQPYFSRHSIDWLTENNWRKDQGLSVPPRPRKVVAPGTPAPGTQPPATTKTPGQSPATAASSATAGERPDHQSGTAGTPDQTSTALGSDTPAQRTDEMSVTAASSERPDHVSATATNTGEDQHEYQSWQDPDKTPQDPIRAQTADPVGTGRGGSGRDGSGRDGSPALPPPSDTRPAQSRKSSRGRRRRKPRSSHNPHTTGATDA
ncbi:HNH endonuclease [Cellulomonas sp. NPDC058312]|uniref:HNH endonuclease n=1 Tax=Cellulomonas sp. NPDC058312 TaxID=3346441 RepID=UPI0036E35C51